MRLKISFLAAAALMLATAQFSRADYMSISFNTGGTLTSPTGTLNYSYVYGSHSSSGTIHETEITSQYDSLGSTDGYNTNVSPTALTFAPENPAPPPGTSSPTAWILESQTDATAVADLIVFNVHTLYIYPVSELSTSMNKNGHAYGSSENLRSLYLSRAYCCKSAASDP